VKLTMKKLILLITYAVVLVAVIVKIDAVGGWLGGVIRAFEPLYIGFAIAFVLNRPCKFFVRLYEGGLEGKSKKLARPLAVVTAYVLLFAIVSALLALVIPELIDSIEAFVGNLSTYTANIQGLYERVIAFLDVESMADLNLSETLNNALGNVLSSVLDTLTNTIPHLISATGLVVSALVTALLSIVFSVYMLVGAPRFIGQCRRLTEQYLPKKMVGPTLDVARLTADTFTRYVSGQIVEAGILGVLCFIGMCIFGFDYAPLISVIIAVFALVPIAGAYIGAGISAVLLLMIEPMQAIWFLVFLIILQQLEGNLIYPRVVGTSIGLPGIWVLAAVTVGGSLMGFAGLIIGVPLTAVIYTLLRRNLHKREAAGKADEEPAGEPAEKSAEEPAEKSAEEEKEE